MLQVCAMLDNCSLCSYYHIVQITLTKYVYTYNLNAHAKAMPRSYSMLKYTSHQGIMGKN